MSIASEITRLQGAKASLKTSIEAKGVTVPAATTLDGYPALVDQIPQGGGGPEFDGSPLTKSFQMVYTPTSVARNITIEIPHNFGSLPKLLIGYPTTDSDMAGRSLVIVGLYVDLSERTVVGWEESPSRILSLLVSTSNGRFSHQKIGSVEVTTTKIVIQIGSYYVHPNCKIKLQVLG